MPKVALVYDRVNTAYGGAEKLLLALHQLYPKAPLFTSVYDKQKAKWASVFKVKTSFLQKIPFAKRYHRYLALLMPLAFETLDLSEYDIIISITSAEAKGVITKPSQLLVCYLLTPTRYIYSHKQNYLNSLPKLFWLSRLTKKLLSSLKSWDQIAIHRPDLIIPISNLVKQRAKKYYGIKIEKAIYPTIISKNKIPLSLRERKSGSRTRRDQIGEAFQPYLLVISRLVAYKRIDLAIKACQKLNRKLIIIGQGPELNKLKKLASAETKFVSSAGNKQKEQLLANCQALLMPGIEDFGITALEAIYNNKPVIIHEKSGIAEILQNKQKVFKIKSASVLELCKAIKQLNKDKSQLTKDYPQQSKHDTRYFLKEFSSTIERHYVNFQTQLESTR